MNQLKFFYNVIHDLWNFCKEELTKPNSEMNEDDWEHVCERARQLTSKYKNLGENEQQFFTHTILEFMEYVDHQDKEYVCENGHNYWKKKQ